MILSWKQMGCKWVKPDGVTTRSGTIWFGYPNTEGKSLREESKQRRKSFLLNAVSNMISLFWLWRPIRTTSTCWLVLLQGSLPQLSRDCSRGTHHATFERNFRISKSFAGKSTCGQARIMLERQEVYQQRLSDATSLSAKENSRKGKSRCFHPHPLHGDRTSRAAFVKKKNKVGAHERSRTSNRRIKSALLCH